MCGINGIVGKDLAGIGLMNAKTAHRGPNETRSVSFPGLTLGHNRLSIVDLSPTGAQPMKTENGRLTIVFNGEIYNAPELKNELLKRGVTFRGTSDTEVLLYAYETWGKSVVEHLRGMWAFAIFDEDTRTLFLSRDPFGIKPLYIFEDKNTIAFSSEIRGLLALNDVPRTIDRRAVSDLIFQGYITAPTTILKNVHAFLPGENRIIHIDTKKTERFISTLDAPATDEPSDNQLEATLLDSVKHHLIADVPVGLFFSGGIDSAVLAVLLKKLNVPLQAFHIDVPGRSDSSFAKKIAAETHIELKTLSLSPEIVENLFENLIEKMDEPLGDSSLLPTLAVSRLAARDVKVVLSGEGGDELFGGYARAKRLAGLAADMHQSRLSRAFRSLLCTTFPLFPQHFPLRAARGILRRLETIRGDTLGLFLTETGTAAGLINTRDLRERINVRMNERELTDRGLAFDRLISLPDKLLLKADTATMAYSIEGRVPFLDREIFKLVGGAPASWKRRGTIGKTPLRRFLKNHLAPGLVDRPKEGFSTPISRLLLSHRKNELRESLHWFNDHFHGLLPAIDATVQLSLKKRKLEDMLPLVGYSYYAIFILASFARMHNLKTA